MAPGVPSVDGVAVARPGCERHRARQHVRSDQQQHDARNDQQQQNEQQLNAQLSAARALSVRSARSGVIKSSRNQTKVKQMTKAPQLRTRQRFELA